MGRAEENTWAAPKQKTLPVSRKGKGAIPDESGRGLLKQHLRDAANDRNTRAGSGCWPKGGENRPVEVPPILTVWGRGPLGEIDVY